MLARLGSTLRQEATQGGTLVQRWRSLSLSSASMSTKALVYEKTGDPDQVLELRECPAGRPGPGQVLVELVAVSVDG